LIFNRSSPVKCSNSTDRQQIVTSQLFQLSIDRQQIVTSPTFEVYWSLTDRHQSSVRILLIFNRSSPVKYSNSIDRQKIVTSPTFELYWSSTDRHQSSVPTLNSSSTDRHQSSVPTLLIVNGLSPVQRSSSIDLRQIDWELLELNCHDCLSSMLLH
jgi:hypothetical protein